ncbi:MAG: putative sulfate/molybdate transporter [Defluviitaleaceae bacterium]|nr:putative sulfate/molybdate transporter [Defluviitaleaceae bacterium]
MEDRPSGNRYDRLEWAGAFGDLGTLIPFVIGYISILDIDPSGIFITFGIFLIASGLYYRTPFPVQPMKAIGGAAITQAALITPNMIWGAGLFSGAFWLVLGLSGALRSVSEMVSKPVIRGIVLGLGISFIMQGVDLMRQDILVAAIALALVFALLTNKYIPAMFALLLFGLAVTLIRVPGFWQELISVQPHFRLPGFALGTMTWNELAAGILILAIPQIPLTLGNAVIATTAENNRLFPDRPVSEKKVAVSKGLMNLVSPIFGGIPICHGAGAMAAHVRFGARTGGAVVILGGIILALGLFFSNSVLFLLGMIPLPVLGVILFFAGLELAMSARDVGSEKPDYYVLLVTAGFSLWNVGIGFLAGLIIQGMIKRNILQI